MQNETIWRNCTNEEMLEVLGSCPEVIEELKTIGYKELINAYDALLPRYRMDRGTLPVYKDDTDVVEDFEYWYMVDGKLFNMNEGVSYKSKADAQLASVKDTMSELQKRVKAKA